MELLLPLRRLPSLRRAVPTPSHWICPSCRPRDRVPRRLVSSSPSSSTEKPFYVTTPIFYVNATPHVGHMYTMVLADVFKRWHALRGRPSLLSTGTDEHGIKMQQAAERAGVTPQELCDANSDVFRELAHRTLIDHDFFVRTTDADHAEAVRHFWKQLQEKGYIYASKHEGWYSVSDEAFYPEKMIEKRISPETGKPILVASESGSEVGWMEEKTYHFRMTALKDRLLEFFKESPAWVSPPSRMAEVVDWVENNLEDLSISRSVDRLHWGIRVPGDDSQTMYVWVDALINYIAKAGYPWRSPEEMLAQGWPADIHIVGKDIVRFHAVYWPALLMALDLPLPRHIISHGHWLLGRHKMSKSTHNVVDPFMAIERFGADVMRFYLMYDGPLVRDADYHNLHIVERYKKCLQGGFGNLLSRVTRPKKWSVQEAVRERASSPADVPWDEHIARQRAMLTDLVVTVTKQMELELKTPTALKAIVDASVQTNVYLTHTAPWTIEEMTSLDETARTALLHDVVFHAAESLRIIAILLQPFMPLKAKRMLDVLGVAEERRSGEWARLQADDGYGKPFDGANPGEGTWDSLFPKLMVEK